MSPLYIDVSGLTEEELSPTICPGAILPQKVKRLCRGGDDIHNDGFGWLGSGFTSGDVVVNLALKVEAMTPV